MKKILVANIGTASKKYSFYEDGAEKVNLHFEETKDGIIFTEKVKNLSTTSKISQAEYEANGATVVKILKERGSIANEDEISAVGFRIVAPGKFFTETLVIDAEYLENLKKAGDIAPLHIRLMTGEIESMMKILPNAQKLAVSDSTFYKEMPEFTHRYALPKEMSERFDVYRFGYHGISMQSVVRKLGSLPPKTIICHLGSGTSITALLNGKPLDTTMGFTPLEGVMMSTRIGDFDAGALIYLLKKTGKTPEELRKYLSEECGLKGVSEKSGDIRDLVSARDEGDENAKLALQMFVHRIKKYIGAYTAALGGLDQIVFTGMVGQRSFILRREICDGLQALGISIDLAKNDITTDTDADISGADSKAKVLVVWANEMGEIAQEMERLG